ncbi:hypothetical protein ACLKA6_010986 [Drosophila palustris]
MLLKSLLLLCCLVLIQGAAVPEQDESPAPIVHILNDVQMAKFLSENPDAIKLNREVKQIESRSARTDYDLYGLTWTLGSRQTGDATVYAIAEPIQWFDDYYNPLLTVQYPTSGSGKIVTYVSIFVQQSSPLGEAYVIEGGIGQRNIKFYVQGYFTHFWSWDIKIYGKN